MQPLVCESTMFGPKCGVLAIGRCSECGVAYCDSHRKMFMGHWYCEPCAEKVAKPHRERQVAEATAHELKRAGRARVSAEARKAPARFAAVVAALRAAGGPGTSSEDIGDRRWFAFRSRTQRYWEVGDRHWHDSMERQGRYPTVVLADGQFAGEPAIHRSPGVFAPRGQGRDLPPEELAQVTKRLEAIARNHRCPLP